MPRRSLSSLRALLFRCAKIAAVLLLGMWALFHVVSAFVLAFLVGVFWLATLPVRSELRRARARLLPRHRRRLCLSEADVDVAFRHIVRAEFGSSR